MLDPRFSDALAASGFAHRASPQSDGSVVYRLAGKRGSVRLSQRDWQALGEAFEVQLAPVRARTRKLSIGLFPAIFLFGMTLAQWLPLGGPIILAAIFLGPLAIYFWHSRDVKRVSEALETRLASFPAAVAVEPRNVRRPPRWIEIALLILVGPHLLISVIGQAGGPDIFRGTPFSGRAIGMVELLAFFILFLRLGWPRVAHWFARAG